jgi:hypothetical protein
MYEDEEEEEEKERWQLTKNGSVVFIRYFIWVLQIGWE